MTTVLTAQFVVFQHLMQPGQRPIRELAALPIMYGILVGIAFGGFEVLSKPQVIHKPALARYQDSLGRKPVVQIKEKPEEKTVTKQ